MTHLDDLLLILSLTVQSKWVFMVFWSELAPRVKFIESKRYRASKHIKDVTIIDQEMDTD